MELCELTHKLPYKQEEELQEWFIDVIGYHCPFATWAFKIDEKYEINMWLVNDDKRN